MTTVLITGVAGLLGSRFAEWIIKNHPETTVIGVDDLSGGDFDNIPPEVIFYNADCGGPALEHIFGIHKIDYVVHFAAYAAECVSPFIRKFNYTNNLTNTANVINMCIKHNAKRLVFTSCHDAATRVVTSRGTKFFWEITKDDMVFSLNPKTKLVEETKIDQIHISQYKGEMVSIEGRRTSALITPNHRILTQTGRNQEYTYVPAEEIKSRTQFQIPIGDCPKFISDQETYMFDPNHFHGNTRQPRSILKEDLYYLLGLYIADGSSNHKKLYSSMPASEYIKRRNKNGTFQKTEKDSDEKHYRVNGRIRFSVPEADKARAPLLEVLTRNKINWTSNKEVVTINHNALHQLFYECSNRAHTKKIPEWALVENNINCLNKLYCGLMDGDGASTGKQYTTVSPVLRDQIIILAFKLGKCATINKYAPRTSCFKDKKLIVGKYPVYRINISTTTPHLTDKNVSTCEYNGPVWCLTVPHSNFLVERNGKYHFSGNSMAVYGNAPVPFEENMTPNPIDPYGVAKFACEMDIKIAGEQHGLDWCIIRPHNCVGRNQNLFDSYRNVLGIFIYKGLNNQPLTVYGDGLQQRAFSDMRDIVEPLWNAVMDREASKQIINLGGIKERTVLDAANIISDLAKVPIEHLPPRHEVRNAWSTHKKSEEILGFVHKTELEESIQEMWEWAKTVKMRPRFVWKEYEIENGLYSYWQKDKLK